MGGRGTGRGTGKRNVRVREREGREGGECRMKEDGKEMEGRPEGDRREMGR